MITGRLAASMRASASSRAAGGGLISASGTRPSGPPALTPSPAAIVCTSSGKTRCETPCRNSACLHASDTSSACGESCRTVCDQSATALKAARRSTSWKLCTPSTDVCTWPVSASTGERSTFASHNPVSRFVAPGPAIVRQAAGRPVSLP